jgi:hypothetical protein
MRPITSNVDSPFLNLSSWLLNELRHIVGMEGFDVSNSIDFIQKVKDIVLQDDEILMSFDVVSLFPEHSNRMVYEWYWYLQYINEWLR